MLLQIIMDLISAAISTSSEAYNREEPRDARNYVANKKYMIEDDVLCTNCRYYITLNNHS